MASILVVQSSLNQDKKQLAKASSGALQSAKVPSKALVPQGQSNEPKRTVSVYRQRRSYGRVFSLEYSKTDWKTFGPESSSVDLIEEENSYLIGSPLFGLYAKLSVRCGPFSPWGIAIEFPHFIDQNDEYVCSIMKSDNLLLFQRALGDGLIKSHTEMKWWKLSRPLFQVSDLQLIDHPFRSGITREMVVRDRE